MQGKILFYNPQTGEGKLITESGEKLDFTAEHWDDFNEMPEAGKTVACRLAEGALTGISPSARPVLKAEKETSPEKTARSLKDGKATFTIEETLESYFKPIDFLIGDPPEVVNTKAQLDYFLVRRFLMTAYNDLKSLDSSLHRDPEVTEKLEVIQELYKAYRNVKDRVDKYKLAFEMIFLRSQPEYLRFIRHKEQCLNRISTLSAMEESLFPDIQKREEALKELPKNETDKRLKLEEELKKIRKSYVDAIHENAGLAEELSTLDDVKGKYSERYYDDFVRELLKKASFYMEEIKKILNYKAYEFDTLMWKHAAHSKAIQEYFASSRIKGEYSILTFLRYYLKTLDKELANEEQLELFKLQEYLEKRKK